MTRPHTHAETGRAWLEHDHAETSRVRLEPDHVSPARRRQPETAAHDDGRDRRGPRQPSRPDERGGHDWPGRFEWRAPRTGPHATDRGPQTIAHPGTPPHATAPADHLDPREPADAAGEETAIAVAADLRRAVIDRMTQMNALHAANAWELRRRDPIAPHALAFLFAQPDDRPGRAGRFRLTAATKLWLAGEAQLDLPERLFRYRHSIGKTLAALGADVRDLADKRDPHMADHAVYIGLGVSSLDTPTGTWAQVVATARVTRLTGPAEARVGGEHDIPGSVRVVLADGAVVCVERRGMPEFNHRAIASTATLDYTPYDSPYPWTRTSRDQLVADPAHAHVLSQMDALNELCWQTDQTRLVHHDGRRP